MSALTDKMDKLIIQKGVAKTEFYKAVEISSATYSQWRSGQFRPRLGKLQQIADYLGVPPSYLLSDDTETQKAATPKGDGLSSDQMELLSIVQRLDPDAVRYLLAKAQELLEFRITQNANC